MDLRYMLEVGLTGLVAGLGMGGRTRARVEGGTIYQDGEVQERHRFGG